MLKSVQLTSESSQIATGKPQAGFVGASTDGFDVFAKILEAASNAGHLEAVSSVSTETASHAPEIERPISAAGLLAASLTSALWAGEFAQYAIQQPEVQAALRISPKKYQNELLGLANNLSQPQPQLAGHLVSVWQLGDTGLASAA